jgi:hypothetical protein
MIEELSQALRDLGSMPVMVGRAAATGSIPTKEILKHRINLH